MAALSIAYWILNFFYIKCGINQNELNVYMSDDQRRSCKFRASADRQFSNLNNKS